jgi:hypothetical protein
MAHHGTAHLGCQDKWLRACQGAVAIRNPAGRPGDSSGQAFVTSVAIVSLALGIGANAAIFSLYDQLVLRPLAVRQP